jgi:hypothetical protein
VVQLQVLVVEVAAVQEQQEVLAQVVQEALAVAVHLHIHLGVAQLELVKM